MVSDATSHSLCLGGIRHDQLSRTENISNSAEVENVIEASWRRDIGSSDGISASALRRLRPNQPLIISSRTLTPLFSSICRFLAIFFARGKALAQDNADWRTKAVIRINRIQERSTLRLIVEGSLSGAWVDELEKCWLDVRAARNGDHVRVDLSGVSYIDDKGRLLLKGMFRDGAELRATGVMTKGIIEEIANDAD